MELEPLLYNEVRRYRQFRSDGMLRRRAKVFVISALRRAGVHYAAKVAGLVCDTAESGNFNRMSDFIYGRWNFGSSSTNVPVETLEEYEVSPHNSQSRSEMSNPELKRLRSEPEPTARPTDATGVKPQRRAGVPPPLKNQVRPLGETQRWEDPVFIRNGRKDDYLMSPFSTLKHLLNRKKTLRCDSAFTVSAAVDKRGLVVIPIRHDISWRNTETGSVSTYKVEMMDNTRTQEEAPPGSAVLYNTQRRHVDNPELCPDDLSPPPTHQKYNKGIIYPRINLPLLERESWKLNCMKIIPPREGNVLQLTHKPHMYDSSGAEKPAILAGAFYQDQHHAMVTGFVGNDSTPADSVTYMASMPKFEPINQLSSIQFSTLLSPPPGPNDPLDPANATGPDLISQMTPTVLESVPRWQIQTSIDANLNGNYGGFHTGLSTQAGNTVKATLQPKFETQLGRGHITLTATNTSLNGVVVEIILLKAKTPSGSPVCDASYAAPSANVIWSNAYDIRNFWYDMVTDVGLRWATHKLNTTSLQMGRDKSMWQYAQDFVDNPYLPWLPTSAFRSTYFSGLDPDNTNNNTIAFGNYDAVNQLAFNTRVEKLDPGTGLPYNPPQFETDIEASERNAIATAYTQNQVLADNIQNLTYASTALSNGKTRKMGDRTGYTVVSRGSCEIAGNSNRTIKFSLPKCRYDASQLSKPIPGEYSSDLSKFVTDKLLGTSQFGMCTTLSEQGYMLAISVNGQYVDRLAPGNDTHPDTLDNLSVLGKCFSDAKVNFVMKYKEDVYASVCDYEKIPVMSTNFGATDTPIDYVSGPLSSSVDPSFPGTLLSLDKTTFSVSKGSLATGAGATVGRNAAR